MFRSAALTVLALTLAALGTPSVIDAGLILEVNSTLDTSDAAIDTVCDDGAGNCTLRAAIQESNAQPGKQPIHFDIATGHQTISPLSALPEVTDPVTIDGTTQGGYGGTPIIELDGSLAGAGATGLHITAGESNVTALVINGWGAGGFSGIGIHLEDGGLNVIQTSYIGTDHTGTTAKPNRTRGIYIESSADNLIGGSAALRRNVISGNGERGVMIIGLTSAGNRITGNYIGADASGVNPLGNGSAGVHVQNAPNNVVGGDQPGEGNVISANEAAGIEVFGGDAVGNIIQGNLIGTDRTGTLPLGNENPAAVLGGPQGGGPPPAAIGIVVSGAVSTGPSGTIIGGASEGARNVIADSQGSGVLISGAGTDTTTLIGNYIGTAVDGVSPLGNGGNGVEVRNAAHDNRVGIPDNPNVIAHNGGNGVHIDGIATLANEVRGNSIHTNGGYGIETIAGGNGELAPPTITGFGSVMGTACSGCTVDVYSDDSDEGRTHEGSATADIAGNWVVAGTPAGPNVTATATLAGSTSEFSVAVAVPGDTTPTPTPTPPPSATPTPSPSATANPGLIQGDVNCSGEVDALDALAGVLDEASFPYDFPPGCPFIGAGTPPFGDVDCDGAANTVDVKLILQYVGGVPRGVAECTAIGEPL